MQTGMEHLDLAGVITMPSNWLLNSFEQQDATYLSNSRQMLEPIIEETSEDEEHAQTSWIQYEQGNSLWSSTESETGSVIRIELNKDPDSISERDFVCPAKRARRSDELSQLPLNQLGSSNGSSQDDTVLLRRCQRNYPLDYSDTNSSLDRFLVFEAASRDSFGANSQQRNSAGSRRFDEFFSDSDSLSYQSLSRSSSLIQFESLERQMQLQEQHTSMSSLGASSPSLLSFDGCSSAAQTTEELGSRSGGTSGSNSGNNSRRGSQSSLLKRFESSDGRLHQTYFELDKLNFDDENRLLFGGSKATIGELKSDSESSTSSSGNSILTASKPSVEDLTDSALSTKTLRSGVASSSILQRCGKSSAENLSEDSGYCEPSTLRRAKSKSIPKNFEKFCEEEEEFQQYADRTDHTDHTDVGEADNSQNTSAQHSKKSIISPERRASHHLVLHVPDSAHHHPADRERQLFEDFVERVAHGGESGQLNITDARFVVAESFEENDLAVSVEAASESRPRDTLAAHTPIAQSSPELSAPFSCHDHCKNSPTRDAREMHSPSPASSESSSTSSSTPSSHCSRHIRSSSPSSSSSSPSSSASASTCASAASFTWLPRQMQMANRPCKYSQYQQAHNHKQNDNQPCQQERHHEHRPAAKPSASQSAMLVEVRLAEMPLRPAVPKQTLSNFYAIQRNSLPDIRDAFSSEAYFASYQQPTSDINNLVYSNAHDKGFVLEYSEVYADDSDSLSIKSPTGRKSHRDATTDAQSTPGASTVRCARGPTGARDGRERFRTQGVRIASVPNELYKLGRKKCSALLLEHTKCSSTGLAARETVASNEHSSSSAEDDRTDDDDDDDEIFACNTRIRRSSSWSERRELKQLATTETCDSIKPLESQALPTYLNASYQDLTLLDYSENKRQTPIVDKGNLKRGGTVEQLENDMTASKTTNDFEDLICKDNFLLDELSEIYDRNVSILNDKPLEIDSLKGIVMNAKLESSSDVEAVVSGSGPQPPPRHRKHSSPNHSDRDDYESNVQHVQLTIRNPPVRQRNACTAEITKSMVGENYVPPTFSTFGKTFDQDPTCLRTSYAQSLEKCNFDPKEVSTTDLSKVRPIPKRRFQSQASASKKKNLVSSTPNLNAYDPSSDDIEDEIYVSSAHNSMSKLPQSSGQKPLGILLPAGSRTSFGKEVSFCPVVSKYSWQEQSSEELNEHEGTPQGGHGEEESDDELLDNADAMVIFNTKENELIASRYRESEQEKLLEEKLSVPVEQQTLTRSERASDERANEQFAGEKTPDQVVAAKSTAAAHSSLATNEHEVKMKPMLTPTITTSSVGSSASTSASAMTVVAARSSSIGGDVNDRAQGASVAEFEFIPRRAVTKSGSVVVQATIESETPSQTKTDSTSRPFSIQLPILSEPPINRAHHILYASQQLLDNLESGKLDGSGERRNINSNCELAINEPSSQVQSVISNKVNRMPKKGSKSNEVSAIGVCSPLHDTVINNNNESMKSKFKADEKHPNAKGFLSRFAHGFRFSLRRNKKKQQQQLLQQQNHDHHQKQQQQQQQQLLVPNKRSGNAKEPDTGFIYIPLKGPLPTGSRSVANENHTTENAGTGNESGYSVSDSKSSTASTENDTFQMIGPKVTGMRAPQSRDAEHVPAKVTGKPPLPKQQPPPPPVRAGSTITSPPLVAKESAGSHAHYQANLLQSAANFTHYEPQQHQQLAGNQHRSPHEFCNDFLDAERSCYYEDFKSQFNSGMQTNGNCAASAPETADPGSVGNSFISKSSQFSSSPCTSTKDTQKTQLFNNFNMQGAKNSHYNQKIGLIETNLDTQETVITGKARSLINIGPQSVSVAKRLTADIDVDVKNDGLDVYDDDNEQVVANADGVVIVKKKSHHGQAGGSQIASVRRPHKSMEFLLDKENQKNILVSCFSICVVLVFTRIYWA